MGRTSDAMDALEDSARRHLRDAILQRALDPGGVDAWARIDRKIPGEPHSRVIVPNEHDGYSPGAMALRDDAVEVGIERLQGDRTLEDLNCTAEFIDQVDAVLGYGDTSIFGLDPSVAANIVQIGLFGAIWYPWKGNR